MGQELAGADAPGGGGAKSGRRARYLKDEAVPSAQRMVVGNALRVRREQLGLKQEEVARLLGGSNSKVSRIESGQHQFKERDLARFFAIYQVTDPLEQDQLRELAEQANQMPWWQPWAGVTQRHLQAVVSFEDMAQRIRSYEPQQLSGLLQTEEYARAVIASGGGDTRQRDALRVFSWATDRVTPTGCATHEAPVPLGEVFEVSTHRHRSRVGSVFCRTRPAARPGRVGNHAHRHP